MIRSVIMKKRTFTIEEATIAEMQSAIKAKKISYRELVTEYMGRIAQFDSCENGLNSVMEINPDALQLAQLMDENKAPKTGQPLYGIPILLKDNINTADKMRTSAGSHALADNFASSDAVVAQHLRRSGALFLGKANMTEFANYMTKNMPGGYSSRGGQVMHPYNREGKPSGSSTGSGVAVAANLCAVSVGTETCGSVIAPSIANGIVGIKPTAGLLSGGGIIPISNTLDTAGPMARTVTDAAILLGAMGAGKDYAHDLDSASVKGLRVGVYGVADESDEEYSACFEQVLSELEKAGTIITRNVDPVPNSKWSEVGRIIAVYEFKRSMEYYLSGAHSKMKALSDIIKFNLDHKEQCLQYGQTVLLECFEASGRLIEPEYLQALRQRETVIRDFHQLFDGNSFDILFYAGMYSAIAPTAGFPAGTIPVGLRKNGLPVGLNFIARPHDETKLIRAMYAAERLIGHRVAPVLS